MADAATSDRLKITSPQGVDSTTWTRPPFYGDDTIPQLYAFHAEKSPEHPVIVYDDEKGAVRELRYKDVFPAIRKAAHFVNEHLNSRVASHPWWESLPSPVRSKMHSLSVLYNITLMTLLIGIMYLGHTAFPISVRNSAVAVAHLVLRMGVRDLLVSADAAMHRIAHEAQEELAKEGYTINLVHVPQFHNLYNEDELASDIKMGATEPDKPAMILHSSGSTSFPKPIPLTHRALTRWGFLSYFSDFDLCGRRISMHCLPMFHIMGAINIPWTVCTGGVVGQFRPSSPPTIPTPETGIRAIAATRCEMALCVPSMLEVGCRTREHLYAGALLGKDIGKLLLDEGVKLVTAFGMTEIGACGRVMPDQTKIPRDRWQYFTLSQPVEFVRVYQEGLPGVFELVVVDSPTWSPNAFNTEIGGRPAYATSDLFEEHPEDSNIYRVYGRADDQIILSTGEKTNPVPIEAILLQDPHVHAALMFGRGRFQNGVIIQPKELFDPSDDAALEAFRNVIWPTVERANNFAPSHSRIFKEMVTVTKPGKPFQYTAKGTPRRHVSLAEYAQEIEELYRRVEESSQVDVSLPETWTAEGTRTYIRTLVKKVLRAGSIGDDDDLFQQGCDSLQATWIRNTILHAVRTTSTLSTRNVPGNFVYLYPTITALSTFLIGVVSGKSIDKDAARATSLAEMHALVEKYSTKWPNPQWTTSRGPDGASGGDTFLVTGTTGRVGSHLLAQLVQKHEVVRVYALNREPSGEAEKLEARQREAFKSWGLDPDLLSGGKVVFLPVDLLRPSFGLDQGTYDERILGAPLICDSAWRVDFNVSLPSFEPLIAGTRNLLDFALSSSHPGGPKVLFVSSIASANNHPADTLVPETLDLGPVLAIGQGYGESKWIAEQIIGSAAVATGLRATAVRVGQLCGDTRVGGWSTSEWVPLLVRAGLHLRAMPAREDTISWVPVDVAASVLLEMLRAEGTTTGEAERILHLTAPRPAKWNDVFAPIAGALGVPLVPSAEWLDKLRDSAKAASEGARPGVGAHDAAHNLLPFFEAAMAGKEVKFSTERAAGVSEALAQLLPVGKQDAGRWLEYWRSVGFLQM
ncbi:acetyl-CoA synthetase-like protein [Trametes polyzona]|nr:acetyl-CoA synthetase-like protein [Trametes polyzona]